MDDTTFLEKLVGLDKDFFLFLNDKNTNWLDPVMLFLSSPVVFIIICVLVALFLVYMRKRIGVWAALFLASTMAANSLINNLVKIIVERPRPIHEEAFGKVIHAIEGFESSFSFFSAHSSNAFSLALFSSLFLRNKYYTYIIIVWAAMVAYSRIYVGKHYPLDVLCGITFGVCMGILGYRLFNMFREKKLEPVK